MFTLILRRGEEGVRAQEVKGKWCMELPGPEPSAELFPHPGVWTFSVGSVPPGVSPGRCRRGGGWGAGCAGTVPASLGLVPCPWLAPHKLEPMQQGARCGQPWAGDGQ